NRFKQLGYRTVLLEQDCIGGIQSLASQGMIHGGQKYHLGFNKRQKVTNVARCTGRWNDALSGTGDIDLQEVVCLSEHQWMWAAGSMLSEVALRSAAIALRASVTPCKNLPEVFRNIPGFSSTVFQLPEKVLDV